MSLRCHSKSHRSDTWSFPPLLISLLSTSDHPLSAPPLSTPEDENPIWQNAHIVQATGEKLKVFLEGAAEGQTKSFLDVFGMEKTKTGLNKKYSSFLCERRFVLWRLVFPQMFFQ